MRPNFILGEVINKIDNQEKKGDNVGRSEDDFLANVERLGFSLAELSLFHRRLRTMRSGAEYFSAVGMKGFIYLLQLDSLIQRLGYKLQQRLTTYLVTTEAQRSPNPLRAIGLLQLRPAFGKRAELKSP
jgi:hypothetical protein